MGSVEFDQRQRERREHLLPYILEQHKGISSISGMKFCFKKVTDDRAHLDGGYLTDISSMAAVPYLAILGPNVTEKDEEAIKLHQYRSKEYYSESCLVVETPSKTLGKIIIRVEFGYDIGQRWLVQERDEDFWNISMPTNLDRILRENKEIRCLGVYLYKDPENDSLKADIFPVQVNAKEIIALCTKENKGWMKMDKAEQQKQTEIKSDRMLREYLKSPEDFFNALWGIARAKTNRKESTPISRPVAFDNHISGIITSYGYSERTNAWGDVYGTVSKNIFHKTHVMLKLTDISQSSFEEGIVHDATSSVDLCNVEIYWLANGDVFYILTKEKPDGKEQRNRKENLNEATRQWLASIIDMLHFSDV